KIIEIIKMRKFINFWFNVVEAGIETGGLKFEFRVSRTSVFTSIDNLKRKLSRSRSFNITYFMPALKTQYIGFVIS
ncbi:MAG: hypothetical protein WAV28_08670, partial [Sedimentisphaerales bacterium]